MVLALALATTSFDAIVSLWEYTKLNNEWECTTPLEGHKDEVKCMRRLECDGIVIVIGIVWTRQDGIVVVGKRYRREHYWRFDGQYSTFECMHSSIELNCIQSLKRKVVSPMNE
jgi:hypothetical protein